MTIEREEPAQVGLTERQMLDGWLDYHRATLLAKCEGLSDEQLRTRSVPPSSMSLLGLVRHMTEVELWWFSTVIGGAPEGYRHCTDEDQDGDWNGVDTAHVAADFATFDKECSLSRTVVADLDLDHEGIHPHGGRHVSLRWAMTHMIEEYARHNGHADLLRECIDGATGE